MTDVLNQYFEPDNIIDGTRGNESLLRKSISERFMKPKSVLPCFTTTRHWCLYYPASQQPVTGCVPKSYESSPRPFFSRNYFILNSRLFLGLPSGPFPAIFSSKFQCTFLSSSIMKDHWSDKIEENEVRGTELWEIYTKFWSAIVKGKHHLKYLEIDGGMIFNC